MRTKLDLQARSATHQTFAANLRRVINLSDEPSVNAWCRRHRLEPRSIQRMLNGEQSPTLDSVCEVARAAGLHAWQLLLPDLDPVNPPVFMMAAAERDVYARIRAQFAGLPPVNGK